MRHRAVPILFLVAVLISSSLVARPIIGGTSPPTSLPPSQPLVAVDPTSITGVPANQQVTFNINVTNAPAITGFYVSILYNRTVLSIPRNGLTYQGNVLVQTGGTLSPVVECVDGISLIGSTCIPFVDQPGVVTLELEIFGGKTPDITNGLLFSLTFNVKTTGVSQIHFLQSLLLNGFLSNPNISDVSAEGSFSNQMCGSQFCQYPIVRLTVTPTKPFQGSPAVFNASRTTTPNSGCQIKYYSWYWGAGSEPGFPLNSFENSSSTVTQIYPHSGNFTLIVGAIDTCGVFGYFSEILTVVNFIIDIGVYTLRADPLLGVVVGTPVTIRAVPENAGTQKANVTLRLFVEGQGEVGHQNFTLPRFCYACVSGPPLTYRWDTSNLTPKAYLVQARVDHLKGDNDTANDIYISYIQIIAALGPSSVSLGLLSTASISILALIAVAVAVLILRPRPKDEPLEQTLAGSA